MSTEKLSVGKRGIALVTGVGRRQSIGATLALALAEDGWDLALNYWTPYNERLGLAREADAPTALAEECRSRGAAVELLPGDLSDPAVPEALLLEATQRLGMVTGLLMSHCESVDSAILDTELESWDRHFAVNARAGWLLIKAFAERLPEATVAGQAQARIVALTSDHVAHNLPYGASKGALDRIVIAAATELADRGVRANVINPGPVDTGWMSDEVRSWCLQETAAGRLGTGQDTANLARFLFSEAGSWINGQLLHSNGGFRVG